MMKRNGFSQLFAIGGALFMLLGLLAVSTLVSRNQDTRNKAAYESCSQVMSNYCSQTGKKCVADINGGHCEKLAPTPTKSGSCNTPGYHCKNGNSYFCHTEGSNLVDSLSMTCGVKGCLNGNCIAPNPTATKVPTPTVVSRVPTGKMGCSPIGNHCVGGDVFSCHMEGNNTVDELYQDCGTYQCSSGKCIVPTPTLRPTDKPLPTAKMGCSPIGNHCVGGDVFSCHMEGNNTVDELYQDCGTYQCSSGKCIVPTSTNSTTFSTINECLSKCLAGHSCTYAGSGKFKCN